MCREGIKERGNGEGRAGGGLCFDRWGNTTMATAFVCWAGWPDGWGLWRDCILEEGLARRALWDIDIVSIEGLEWLEWRLNGISKFTLLSSLCSLTRCARAVLSREPECESEQVYTLTKTASKYTEFTGPTHSTYTHTHTICLAGHVGYQAPIPRQCEPIASLPTELSD